MNLPISSPIVRGVKLDDLIPEKLFLDLEYKKFSGYTFLTIRSEYSFEESILIFLKGEIVGSVYLIDEYDVELFGSDAFQLCLNTFSFGKNGILDIYSLTDDQIKLVLIFNEKIKYKFNISKNKKKLKFKYDKELTKLILKDKIKKEVSKKEILNKFRLSELLRS